MKSLAQFWRVVADDLGSKCRVSTVHDVKTVMNRFEQEGEEFLTLTLPAFGKDFERSLDLGQVVPTSFLGFKKRGKLPVFLGGFLDLLFDRDTGTLLDMDKDNSRQVEAVFAVRQLTLMYGKLLKPCTPERESAAFDSYVKCEQELRQWEKSVPLKEVKLFGWISRQLFGDVFRDIDNNIENFNVVPKHGPGSTADRLLGNEKFDQREWTDRLETVFPFVEYAIPNLRYHYLQDQCQFLEPGAERPVRVISVPKTQKTPRIIAIEPTCMQFMQQALWQQFEYYLSTDKTVAGMIGFRDQIPNQEMAMVGSRDGSLATLDLSEASDRVSYLLVEEMFSKFTHLMDGVSATRSLTADVPEHGLIRLRKFASMGSALCFPVEAMVFLTCIFHGISKALSVPVTRPLIREWSSRVRVYGDDIIVPVEFTASVVNSLELFGFKVNSHKSFWTGKFRESCGAEFYDGRDVSITRIRREFPQQRSDVEEVVSLVSLRNQFYAAGLWSVAEHLDDRIVVVLPHYPTVHPSSSALGRHTYLDYESQRSCATLHAPLVKGYAVSSKIPSSLLTGEGALMKCLSKQGFEPFEDEKHLQRQGRPDAVRIKLRWLRPF